MSRPQETSPAAAPRNGKAAPNGVAAMVRTIDLTTVRVHVGARFPGISERLHAQLQKDMKQALSGVGWFWPMGDLFYLVVLWGVTETDAADLLQRLVAQLHTHLRELKVDTTGLFVPVNAAHLDRRGRPRIDAIQSLEEGDAESRSAPTVEERPSSSSASFAFEPVWNVRQGVVSAFRCIRKDATTDSALTIGEAMAAEAQEAVRLAKDDQDLLRHVIGEWSKLAADAVCLMIVPVRFETLASAISRRDYLAACGVVPIPLRRLLIFEIEQVPDGVMNERLLDMTRYVKSFCRSVTARVSFEFQQFEAIHKAGVSIVACHVGTRSEQRSLQLMERFVERAEKQKLQTGIYGIRSVSLTTAALAAGFVYIGGEAVSSLAGTPRGLFKFDMADVYRGSAQLDT